MSKKELDFNLKCRACFSEDEGMHHLYIELDQGLTLSEILKSIMIPLEIKEDDGLSPFLCENCTTTVIDFFNFKTIYQENEKYIKSCLSENNLKNKGKIRVQEKDSKTETCGNEIDKCITKHSNASGISKKFRNNKDVVAIMEVFEDCSPKEDMKVDQELPVESFVDPQDIVEQGIETGDEIIIKQEEDVKTKKTMKYHCQECGDLFLLKIQFLQHMKNQHKNTNQHDEHTSNPIIKTEKPKKTKVKIEDVILKCKICKKDFLTSSELETHYSVHKKYICEHCGTGFTKKSYLEDHYEGHTTEKRHVCPACGKAFRWRAALAKHKKLHTHPRQCVCETCGRRFNDKGTLKTHIMLKHTKEKNFQCIICELWFPLKISLNRHMLCHTEKRERPFTCSLCPMAYRDKSSLNRHKIVKHTSDAKKPSCNYCSKEYSTNTNLQKHINKHHKSEVNLDSDWNTDF